MRIKFSQPTRERFGQLFNGMSNIHQFFDFSPTQRPMDPTSVSATPISNPVLKMDTDQIPDLPGLLNTLAFPTDQAVYSRNEQLLTGSLKTPGE